MRRIEQIEELAEYLGEVHQVECSVEQLEDLQLRLWEHCNQQKAGRLAEGNHSSSGLRADVGRALGFIFGAVLGVLFLPGLLGIGALSGALIGGAIGYRLVGLFDQPQRQQSASSVSDPLFAFSGSGSLARLNSPIPIIYGNKDINPDGGVYRRDPALIYSSIKTELGSQKLTRVSLLAVGRLGRVELGGLQLDDQPLSNYNAGDILTEVSTGLHNQSVISGIDNYSQAVAVNSNGLLGLSPGIITGSSDLVSWSFSASVGSSLFLPAQLGSTLHHVATPEGTTDLVIGLMATYSASPAIANIDAAARIMTSGWELSLLGTVVASGSQSASPNGIILRLIRSYPSNVLQLVVNRVEVYREVSTLPETLFPVVNVLAGTWAPSYVSRRAAVPVGDLLCGYGTRFALSDAGLSKIRSAQTYLADTHIVGVTGRDANAKWIELGEPFLISDQVVDSSLVPGTKFIKSSATFLTIYRAVIATSKAVTSVDITIKASVWAKNGDGNEAIHAQAFELAIETEAGTSYTLHRFLVASSKQQQFFRTITITNLPKARYKIRLTPIPASAITANISTLNENSVVSTITTSAVIAGQAINLLTELGASATPATAASWMSFDGKPQHSDQSGPSLQVAHLNEIVDPITPPRYPSYTVVSSKITASDRIQNAATESWLVAKGQIVRNHMFSRYVVATEAETGLLQMSESFTMVGGLPRGAILRILGKGAVVVTEEPNPLAPPIFVTAQSRQSSISTTINSSIITLPAADYAWATLYMGIAHPSIPSDAVVIEKLAGNQLLLGDEWGRMKVATATGTATGTLNPMPASEPGDSLIGYTMDSSNYFPDLFVDRLINPVTGLGNSVNGDYFIDYNSIVDSRDFCVKNSFFYDGVIAEGSFEEWATASAPSSLLYPTLIEGKYALLPQVDSKPVFLFTDSNTSEFREHDLPYQQTKTSVVLVRYQDNLGRERQVRISTEGVANGSETEITRTIETKGVTAVAQAIRIGQVALKSLRLQTRACDIKSDVATGLYARQGHIVRSQHVQIEYCDENSGFVMAAQPPTNYRDLVIKTIPIVLFSSGYIDLAEPHELRRLGVESMLPSDSVEISGVSAAVDGIYGNTDGVAAIRIMSRTRLFVVCSGTGISATTGTIKVIRKHHDQMVKLSGAPATTANTRITIGHGGNGLIDTDRTIIAQGNGLYKIVGLQAPAKEGDNYAAGESQTFDRVWRITSVKPDVATNSVQMSGVLWDKEILSTAGLVTYS
jgi:hypothetical protein